MDLYVPIGVELDTVNAVISECAKGAAQAMMVDRQSVDNFF